MGSGIVNRRLIYFGETVGTVTEIFNMDLSARANGHHLCRSVSGKITDGEVEDTAGMGGVDLWLKAHARGGVHKVDAQLVVGRGVIDDVVKAVTVEVAQHRLGCVGAGGNPRRKGHARGVVIGDGSKSSARARRRGCGAARAVGRCQVRRTGKQHEIIQTIAIHIAHCGIVNVSCLEETAGEGRGELNVDGGAGKGGAHGQVQWRRGRIGDVSRVGVDGKGCGGVSCRELRLLTKRAVASLVERPFRQTVLVDIQLKATG